MQEEPPPFPLKPAAIPPGDVLVYEYGCRLDADSARHADEQFRLAQNLYNELIELMQRIHADMSAWTLEQAGLQAQALDTAARTATAAFDAARLADDTEAMGRIAAQRQALWRELAVHLKAARTQHAAELRTRFYSRIGRNSRCETYQLHSAAIRQGLGWATAGHVLSSALLAWQRALVHGSAPRFMRGDDDEQRSLVLQFTDKGGLAMQRLLDGSWPELWLQCPDEARPRRYGTFRFRLGLAAADLYATGSWQYHRPLPADARATCARLVRRRVADKFHWALQVVVKLAEPLRLAAAPSARLAAVHFGWGMQGQDAGRSIAAIAGSADPLQVRDVQLPPDIEADLQRSARLQAEREQSRMAAVLRLPELCAAGCSQSAAAEIAALMQMQPRFVAVRRLQVLRLQLKAEGRCPEWLALWVAEDRKARQASVSLARRARHRRRQFYQRLALDLARRFSAVVIRPLDLKAAATRIDARTGLRSALTTQERVAHAAAALNQFEEAIRWACCKHGTALFERTASAVESCLHCGAPMEAAQVRGRPTPCRNCGADADDPRAGAAHTWQHAMEGIEARIVDYHAAVSQARLAVVQQRAARLARMAQGRRPRRAPAIGGWANSTQDDAAG